MSDLLWEYRVEKPGIWDDYTSRLLVFRNRLEYTLGWKNPIEYNIPAAELRSITRGKMTMKNIVIIETTSWPPHELMSSWDRQTQEALLHAVKQIIPVDVQNG